MCDGMKMDRRLVLIGVMLVVLSMTMATQYATTEIAYSFAIVHPSEGDLRFISSDNSSDDALPVLRITNNVSGAQYLTVELGDWTPGSQKNYTAAFGIVNEEAHPLNITHINFSSLNATYMKIYLHGNRTADASNITQDNSSVFMWNKNTMVNESNTTAWILA